MASEAVEGAKKDFAKFKTEMNLKLKALDNQVDELRNKAAAKGSEARQKSLTEIEESKTKIKKDLNDLKEDGKGTWKSFKNDLSKAMDNLHTKIQKALKD